MSVMYVIYASRQSFKKCAYQYINPPKNIFLLQYYEGMPTDILILYSKRSIGGVLDCLSTVQHFIKFSRLRLGFVSCLSRLHLDFIVSGCQLVVIWLPFIFDFLSLRSSFICFLTVHSPFIFSLFVLCSYFLGVHSEFV